MTAKYVVDASPSPAPKTLLQLFQKITHFKLILVYISAFKRVFK